MSKNGTVVEVTVSIPRSALLISKAALFKLGSNNVAVGKDKYWMGKNLGRIGRALAQEEKKRRNENNNLVRKFGAKKDNENGVPTLTVDPSDFEAMSKYNEGMDAFDSEEVVLTVRKYKLEELEKMEVKLSLIEIGTLYWLIEE